MTDPTTVIDPVPWGADPFRFCLLPEAPSSVAVWFEKHGWRAAATAVSEWVRCRDGDPFAVVARLSLNGDITADRAAAVFASICDHRRSGFEEKRAMIAGWAEAVAGIGPSGAPGADLLLWRTAWRPGYAPPSPDGDIHSTDTAGLFRALEDRWEEGILHHSLRVCDAFLDRLPDDFDSEASGFAVSVLRDELAVEGKVYDTYRGLFGAVLELLHWPAMASGNAKTRIESSLLGVACERRTSYAISQVASSTPGAPPSFFG